MAGDTSGSSQSLGPQSVTAGHLLVVFAGSSSASGPSVSDTGSNTWTQVDASLLQSGVGHGCLFWAIAKATASITVTVTATSYVGVSWQSWAPDAGKTWAAAAVDGTSHGITSNAGTTHPVASAAFTPGATDLVIGGNVNGGNSQSYTPDAAYADDAGALASPGVNQSVDSIYWQEGASATSTRPGEVMTYSAAWVFAWAAFTMAASGPSPSWPAWRRRRGVRYCEIGV